MKHSVNSFAIGGAARRSALPAAILAGIALGGFGTVAVAADDGSLTWNGITLYGVVDIGIAYQSHGAPLSQDFYTGLDYLVSKNGNKSITSFAPSGLSQSKIGLQGKEELVEGVNGIFNVEMGFNPTSGKLADALGSLVHNNGVPLANQTTASDGSRAGQLFNGVAYLGLQSKDWGTITFGRNNTLLLDTINKYDPMGGSYAFSVIGYSGLTAGGGNTENTRLDDSIKYTYKYDLFHAGLLYQFGKSDSSPGEAWQLNGGFDYAGFSVDANYAHKKDAIAASSLSAAQLATGVPQDSLAATISDNTAWNLAASYTTGPFKFSGGYEHIRFKNPSLPISSPFSGLGGYYFSIINNSAYTHPRVTQVSWLGARYAFSPNWDITGAWYHYDQNSYKGNGCHDTSAGSCSGSLDAYSVMTDYRFTKRLDVYAGAMYSRVADGLASGYLHTNNFSPMVGVRFKF
jgi:predicted porin